MENIIFKSRVDWWVYALIPFIFICCLLVPILTKSGYWVELALTILFCTIVVLTLNSIQYAIRGNEMGVRYLYKWQWFPIEEIESVKPVNSILSSAALSTHRIAIRFKDRKFLKSFAPLEISPKDENGFIQELLRINPNIKVGK